MYCRTINYVKAVISRGTQDKCREISPTKVPNVSRNLSSFPAYRARRDGFQKLSRVSRRHKMRASPSGDEKMGTAISKQAVSRQ